jgi:hypothetical protein
MYDLRYKIWTGRGCVWVSYCAVMYVLQDVRCATTKYVVRTNKVISDKEQIHTLIRESATGD